MDVLAFGGRVLYSACKQEEFMGRGAKGRLMKDD